MEKLSFFKSYPAIIFCLSLFTHILISSIGFNHSLSDRHGFRQTQTAISVYYMVKDEYKLNYEVPVFGPPWSVPFEFPTYQFIVTFIIKLFEINIEQTGRLVSLLFFYLTILTIIHILKKINIPHRYEFIIASIMLLNPIYLFWSRTFMIESFALWLAIFYHYWILELAQNPKLKIAIILSIVSGILATLTKVTTFSLIVLPSLVLYIYFYRKSHKTTNNIQTLKALLLNFLPGLLISASIFLIWTNFADNIKTSNLLSAECCVSTKMHEWNFGTISQKLSPQTWTIIFSNIKNYIISPYWLILFLFSILFIKKKRLFILIYLSAFLLGPIVYTNLYKVHDYYFYANTIYLLLAIGIMFTNLLEKSKLKVVTKALILPIFLFFSFFLYSKSYLLYQINNNKYPEIGEIINKITKQNDVILIYGFNWSPELAYYSKRKAIMDIYNYPLDDLRIKQIINNTGKENIKVMIVNFYNPNIMKSNNSRFLQERIEYLNLNPNPLLIGKSSGIFLNKSSFNSYVKFKKLK